MCRVLRHLWVLTLAVSLISSAAAWRQCTGLQLVTAAAASEHGSHATGHHADAAGHGEHDHHAMHHNVQDDPATPAADDHGCMKCCAMCTVAIALPPAADAGTAFAVASRVFPRRHETKSGNVVAVDPGIPKRIV
jgi:uncharacterized protein involved in copper resistance